MNAQQIQQHSMARDLNLMALNDVSFASLLKRGEFGDCASLVIRHSRLTGTSVKTLSHLTRLNHLTLDGCRLDDDAMNASLGWIGHLTSLSLRGNDLTDEFVVNLCQNVELLQLEHLALDGCHLSDRSLLAIAMTHSLCNLRTLSLRGCKDITDEGAVWLAKRMQVHFPNLERVVLGGSQVTLRMRRRIEREAHTA